MEKSVRVAGPRDLGEIAEIYAHYVTSSAATFELTPPAGDEWTRRFTAVTEAGLPFVVAEIDGRIAGYAYCTPWKIRPAYRRTAEDSVYLAPWATGQGTGGLLLDELLARCAATGIREVIAVVAATGDHQASLALHRSRGFTDAGCLTKVGFKHGKWLDTRLLQRSLH
ncbi:MAG TPA: GNAT family N-acetyltransferase [Amycolatopsis sp.]|jgi:phosphinothricin acetyltransferase|nr:GNAT family N-acetyltransferase [Amycolatopsis sp.]